MRRVATLSSPILTFNIPIPQGIDLEAKVQQPINAYNGPWFISCMDIGLYIKYSNNTGHIPINTACSDFMQLVIDGVTGLSSIELFEIMQDPFYDNHTRTSWKVRTLNDIQNGKYYDWLAYE